jgi:ribonuclease D
MVEYALNDVRHLHELAEAMREGLLGLGRLDWHRQTCARLIEECARPGQVDLDQVWRVKGHDRLDSLGLAVLRELWHWREKEAVRANKPPFFILRHEALSDLAENASRSQSAAGLKLPHFISGRRRRGVVEAVERGLAVPASDRPVHVRVRARRMTQQELDRAEDLKKLRDRRAEDLKIDPTLIASRSTLFALGRDDAEAWGALLPWQRALLEERP